MNFYPSKKCEETQADSAGRALGGVISKEKQLRNIRFKTYSQLYNAGVIPFLDYGSEIWDLLNGKSP